MQRTNLVTFFLLFVLLIGILFLNTSPYQIDMNTSDIQDEYSDNLEKPIIWDSVYPTEQEVEINQLVYSYVVDSGADDWAEDVVACENGDHCILGLLNSSGHWNLILIRIDASGHQIWNRTFQPNNPSMLFEGRSVISCSDGGFAIAGQFRNMTTGGDWGGLLIKTNSTGHEEWNMTCPVIGEAYLNAFNNLVQTSEGSFMLVGSGYVNEQTEDDIAVVKTDENGTIIWAEYYGIPRTDEGVSIIECISGDYVISGSARPLVGWESILMRITDEGLLKWYRRYSSDYLYNSRCLFEYENGDLIAGGVSGLIRTDSAGNSEAILDIPIRVNGAVPFGDNRIAVTGEHKLICIDENAVITNTYNLGLEARSLAKCSNGEFVVLGNSGWNVAAARLPWLEWNVTPSDAVVEYGTPLSLNLNATCSQGIYSWSVNDTAHFDIDSQGVLTNLGTLDIGEYPLEIVVNDTLGNRLIQRFTITIEDTTAPTWLQDPETVFLEAGEDLYYDLNATDASGLLIWSLGATYTFDITQTGIITNTMELSVGTYLIEVHVQDASGNILTGIVTLQVEDSQYPIYLVPPSNLVVPYGEVIEFDIIAYDFSGIAMWSQNCTDFTMLLDTEGHTTTAQFTSNGILSPGTYYIAMEITDFSANVLIDLFWVTVTEDDVIVPIWTQVPETQHVEFGQTFSYDLNATDSSGIDDWWLGDDTYFSIDSTGLITELVPLEVGVYTITVFVNDTLGNTLSCSVLVVVSDTTAPVWTSAPQNQVISQDQSLDYQLSASDLSGVSTWLVNDTAHFSIDSQGHLRSIVALAPGVYWVEITASDIYGNNLSTSLSITVSSSSATTTTTTTSLIPTGGVLGSMEILLLSLGSGIGGAVLVIIIYQVVKRR